MAGLFRLSRKFHETIGDDLAEEIEAGFERVDALNSTAFKELFEIRLDQRRAEDRAETRREMGEMKDELRQEIAALREDLAEFRGEIRGELKAGLATLEARLIRWMFIFWLGTIGIVLAQRF